MLPDEKQISHTRATEREEEEGRKINENKNDSPLLCCEFICANTKRVRDLRETAFPGNEDLFLPFGNFKLNVMKCSTSATGKKMNRKRLSFLVVSLNLFLALKIINETFLVANRAKNLSNRRQFVLCLIVNDFRVAFTQLIR